MEYEPARQNGAKMLKEVVLVRWPTSSGQPPVDAATLIKTIVEIFERNKCNTWITQQNHTDPKAIKSVASIPIDEELKGYYSQSDMPTRGTTSSTRYHLTFTTASDIETIKQIPEILEFIKANNLSVSEDVFEGEKAVPIGCLLYIHPDPLKTNIDDLEKDLQYSINFDNGAAQEPNEATAAKKQLKIKFIPKHPLNRRLSLPHGMNSVAIEILATKQDKEEILTMIPGVCSNSDYYGRFLSYSNPDCNICEEIQQHNQYLKSHRYVVL